MIQDESKENKKIDEYNAPRCQEFGKMCEEDHNGNCYFCLRNMLSLKEQNNWGKDDWLKEFDDIYHVDKIGKYSEQLIPNACEKYLIKDFIKQATSKSYQEGYEKGLHDECSRWINQDSNAHDKVIRQSEREKMIEFVARMETVKDPICKSGYDTARKEMFSLLSPN